jgi:hypothetical protein
MLHEYADPSMKDNRRTEPVERPRSGGQRPHGLAPADVTTTSAPDGSRPGRRIVEVQEEETGPYA